MNDPGVEEPISNADDATKKILDDDSYETHRDSTLGDTNYVRGLSVIDKNGLDDNTKDSAKWWYASTAFPLVAGTFGPMANAFSVCALVENWRVAVPVGGTEEHGINIMDAKWLLAINGISLACALVANLALLLNMAKRLKFKIAQPITIGGFWIASILLASILGYASTDAYKVAGRNIALTQAYYYGIFAVALYQVISYLLCITVYGAYRGHYSKSFDLTPAQRTLMLQTISFLLYMHLGALVYCKLEGWKYLDAVYWADYTLLTVGIGNLAPKTHVGQSLLFPFAIGGIIIIGLVVSSIRSLVLDRGAQKMSARMTEKIRRRVVQQVESSSGGTRTPKAMFGVKQSTVNKLADGPAEGRVQEISRRKVEFGAMRRIQEVAARERRYMALLMSTLAAAILWFVGAYVFYRAEAGQQWSYFESLYFAYVSILTIGYGDFFPQSNSGTAFFVFWSLLAVPTLTVLISNMGDTVVKSIKDVTIWFGQISILPEQDSSVIDTLKLGLRKLTFGKYSTRGSQADEEADRQAEEADRNEWQDFRQLHPGLIQLFDASERKKIDQDDVTLLDKLNQAFIDQEVEDEETARRYSDRKTAAEHHYRQLLLAQISKIYRDTKLSTPKQYSYIEWTFYLKLLGEDEGDSSLHRQAITQHHKQRHGSRVVHERDNTKLRHDQEGLASNSSGSDISTSKHNRKTQWSWIGVRSPLMQDQDEADWLLQRLFVKLEASLKQQSDANRATQTIRGAERHKPTQHENGKP